MSRQHAQADELVSAAMSQVARSLRQAGANGVLESIAQAALQAIPGANFASISMSHPDGSSDTLAATDDIAREADRIRAALGAGPPETGAELEKAPGADGVSTHSRWPDYADRLTALGIGSHLTVEMFHAGASHAAVNVFSKTNDAFEESRHIAGLFAAQAAIAMNVAQTAQTLQGALASRKVIGQAMGIVMVRYHLDEDRAFAFLVRASQHRNVKLRAVAQQIVDEHNQEATAVASAGRPQSR